MAEQPGLRVREVDPDSEPDIAEFARIHQLADEYDKDYPTPWRAQELRVQFASGKSGTERWQGLLGFEPSGKAVAAGLIVTPLTDNLDKAFLGAWVDPGHRRLGHGSAMVEELVSIVAADGKSVLLTEIDYPVGSTGHPHQAFAAAVGFTCSNAELHRVLDLPVPTAALDALADEAAAKHDGYRFVDCVDGDVPDDLLPSYLELGNAIMVDAPTGDVDYETGGSTPETFRDDTARKQAMGRTVYRTIAVDRDGRAAAHNVLAVPSADRELVFQLDTLVRREDRGHRLGLAVKVRNLAVVQRLHPERRLVHTWNAASNEHMIAINEALGFRIANESAEYVRRLS